MGSPADPTPGPGAPGEDATVDHSAPSDDDALDEIAEDFAARCRRGDAPSVDAVVARHPEHASRLRELLPAVALMELLKRRSNSARTREVATPLPERLGEFRVVRELGRGGMGVVYEAVQEPLGRHIALKVMHPGQVDPRRLLRFRREAMAVAQLHHTNIVPIHAVGDHDGLPYFAMQHIRGDSLDVVLQRWRSGGTTWRDGGRWRFAARVALEAAGAIQHAHDQGVLHRDLKPANLLIDEADAVWITDFGLAKLVGHDDLTHSGDVIGTLRYLAPEALEGQSGPRGDVYSLGLTLYEMLTLSPPFGDLKPSELIHRVGTGQLPRPRRLDPAIPRDLETIVLKAIAREPGHRYPTAGAMADDLRRFLEDRPIHARPVSPFERAWRWGRRNRLSATLIATASAALVLAAVVGWVGVIRTTNALTLAEQNAQANFGIIEQMVNTLVAREETLPRDPGPGPGGPGRPDGPMGGPPGGGPPYPGPGETSPAATTSADLGLLQVIASSYNRLASLNQANPKLQGQAAWVFFRLGCLEERLGNVAAAAFDCNRALEIFETLSDQSADQAAFARLEKLPDMIDLSSPGPAAIERAERWLRRIGAILDRRPGAAEFTRARARAHLKLALVLRKTGREDRAEPEYRTAIAFAAATLAEQPDDDNRRIDLLEARTALAELLVNQGKLTPGWAELQPCFAEAQRPTFGFVSSLVVAESMEVMADVYREAGQTRRADELNDRADDIDPRPPEGNPRRGPRGNGRGGPGFGPNPGPGRDGPDRLRWDRGAPPPQPRI